MLWVIGGHWFFLALCAAFVAVLELGFRLGRRRSAGCTEQDQAHIGAIQTAVLGLLALLLGFTFFMAVQRFDARKALVLDEANAIGTSALRAGLLPAEQRGDAPALFRAYVDARLAFYAARNDVARIDAANAEAARLERRLWAIAQGATAQDPRSVPAGLFAESLNDVIDIREKRQTALDNHVPEAVIWLLLVVSAAALGLIAFGCGQTGRRRLASNALFALLIALLLTTILDIDRPRRGLIRVGQDSMVRLKTSLAQDAR